MNKKESTGLSDMDAVKFIKERLRMCDSFNVNDCIDCPIEKDCVDTEPELMVKVVEEWSKANPQKTMMQDFFEKFPNAPKLTNGCPKICPDNIYGHDYIKICTNDCPQCWNRPLED